MFVATQNLLLYIRASPRQLATSLGFLLFVSLISFREIARLSIKNKLISIQLFLKIEQFLEKLFVS